MKKIMTYVIAPLAFCFLQVNAIQAQWTIKTEQFDVPSAIAQKAATKYGAISKTPAAAFAELAKAAGRELQLNQTTIYVRANGDYAAETKALEGNTKFVYNNKTKSFSIVQYDQKKVMTGTRTEIEQTTKQAASMMSDLEKTMAEAMKNANLTEEQKKAAMSYLPGLKKEPEKQAQIEDTGDTMQLIGRRVKRFVMKQPGEVTTVWAANDDQRLAKVARDIQGNMKSMLKMGRQKKNEIELLPSGYYPLDTITEESGMVGPDVKVNRTIEIVAGNPGAKPFTVPGKKDGFEVTTLQDAMQGMMQSGSQFRKKR